MSAADLKVVQASNQTFQTWSIQATVVPIEVYQNVTKSLKMAGKPTLSPRVKVCINSTPHCPSSL